MNSVTMKVFEDRKVKALDDCCLGCVKEHGIVNIMFELPESINGVPTTEFEQFIDFENVEDGRKFTKQLQSCQCEICENITATENVKAQVILKKLINEETEEYLIWKSEVFNLHFESSINATEPIIIII